MSTVMKTPGVYIREKDAFGNSVVPVATAVPVFIGYTGKTSYKGKKLVNEPVKLTSLAEFQAVFGDSPPEVKFKISSFPSKQHFQSLKNAGTSTADALAKALAAQKDGKDNGVDADAQKVLDQAVTDAQAANKAANDALDAFDSPFSDLLTAEKNLAANSDDPVPDNLTDAKKSAEAATEAKWATTDFISGDLAYSVEGTSINFRLYGAVKYFYENGGSDCYIMTLGGYDGVTAISSGQFTQALTLLEKETEPTMLLIPDAMEIINKDGTSLGDKYGDAYSLQNMMINHCAEMMNRVAVLDIPGGYVAPVPGQKTSIEGFRDVVTGTEAKFNSYAAAYYPWMHTTVFQSGDVSYRNVDSSVADTLAKLKDLLTADFTPTDPTKSIDTDIAAMITLLSTATNYAATDAPTIAKLEAADSAMKNLSAHYKLIMGKVMEQMNLMGPAAAMAGIYTAVDNAEGVWIAPANVSIGATVKPSIKIDHHEQEDLNMPLSGKSVCAIRAFPGRGNLVWGARTLDGNSNDWRYINVRRTLIFLEQSIKEAAKAYVFAPNDASTWTDVSSMISNFLLGIWKQGGLVGPKPSDAFSVSVGLGSTMTGDDVLNGIMRVMVKVAVSRPAEFIEITFQQEMQKA